MNIGIDPPGSEIRRKLESLLKLYKSKSNIVEAEAQRNILYRLAWHCCGSDRHLRVDTWRALLDLHLIGDSQERLLKYKSLIYSEYVEKYCEGKLYTDLLKTSVKDVPRTRIRSSNVEWNKIIQLPRIQNLIQSILYLTSLDHPAMGYVQGLNDVCLPLLVCFLCEATDCSESDITEELVTNIKKEVFDMVQSDIYWCFLRFVTLAQCVYITGQPAILETADMVKRILSQFNPDVYSNLISTQTEIVHLTVRWINCAFVREFPISCTLKLWDALLTEMAQKPGDFKFVACVCVALLCWWQSEIESLMYEDMLLFFQVLPTDDWTEEVS